MLLVSLLSCLCWLGCSLWRAIPSGEFGHKATVFSRRQLSGYETLKSCSIEAEATIHLVLRLRGGGVPAYFIDDSALTD